MAGIIPILVALAPVALKLAGFAATVILVPLLVKALNSLLARMGINLDAAQSNQLKQIIVDVLRAVEEYAAAQAKVGTPLSSETKLSLAVSKIQAQPAAVGLSESNIKDLVHATLPIVGYGAQFSSAAAKPAGQ